MKRTVLLLKIVLLFLSLNLHGQQYKKLPGKGKLFIIGGGARSPQLMQALLATAQLNKEDYIVVLPM